MIARKELDVFVDFYLRPVLEGMYVDSEYRRDLNEYIDRAIESYYYIEDKDKKVE